MIDSTDWRQVCIHGHDTYVCGRNSTGHCNECQRLYRLESYNKRKNLNRNHAKHPITVAQNSKWRKEEIKNLDGSQFTYADYDRTFQIQGGRCAICGKHQSEVKQTFVADHDHDTKLFRGVLCFNCNSHIVGTNTSKNIHRLENYLNVQNLTQLNIENAN